MAKHCTVNLFLPATNSDRLNLNAMVDNSSQDLEVIIRKRALTHTTSILVQFSRVQLAYTQWRVCNNELECVWHGSVVSRANYPNSQDSRYMRTHRNKFCNPLRQWEEWQLLKSVTKQDTQNQFNFCPLSFKIGQTLDDRETGRVIV